MPPDQPTHRRAPLGPLAIAQKGVFAACRRVMRTHWLIVKTKHARERYAAANAIRDPRSLKVYMPVIEGRRGREEPLFPGLLFVCTHGQWRYLENVYGCTRVIVFGEKVGFVPHKVMRALMAEVKQGNLSRRPVYRYEQNQPLDIVAGPYAGISGLYRETTPEKRICIMLSFMGRMVPVEQEAFNVRAKAA